MGIPFSQKEVPFLTTQQMIEVDRAMMEDYRIELTQMMENAGRNLAHLARNRFLENNPVGKKIVVLAGTGANGGGALVAARRLHNWGANVNVLITQPDEKFTKVPAHQLEILKRMQVPIFYDIFSDQLQEPDLILDGLIGYSLKGAPRGTVATIIDWANNQYKNILSLDIPSGIDATTGIVYSPAINATATMTLALPKIGFTKINVKPLIGELYLADISVPPALYASEKINLQVAAMFSDSEVIRLW